MIVFFWAAGAGILAVLLEFLFKRGWGWLDNWYLFIPAAIALNYMIYRLVTSGTSGGTTWLITLAAFNLTTVLCRAGLSHFIINEPLIKGNLAAAALLISAQIIGRVWR